MELLSRRRELISTTPTNFLKTTLLSAGTVTFASSGNTPGMYVEYSTNNGKSWTKVSGDTFRTSGISVTLNSAGSVLWRGLNINGTTLAHNTTSYVHFDCTVSYSVSGNVLSLVYGSRHGRINTSSASFPKLFVDSTKLVSAEDLELGAVFIDEKYSWDSNYASGRWYNNSQGASYQQMFSGCTSLTTPPKTLPAKTIGVSGYYRMFYGCTALTKAPEIAATKIWTSGCKEMFYNCSNLTAGPKFLDNVSGFYNIDTMPGTYVNYPPFESMLYNCPKVRKIYLPERAKPTSEYTKQWHNVNNTTGGIFVWPGADGKTQEQIDDMRGNNGIPMGWTVLTADE